MHTARITITRVILPRNTTDLNQDLQYLAGSLGLFNLRDKDRSKFRIFIALLHAARREEAALSSDDLALQLGLTRATAVHHLASLAEAGMIDRTAEGYVLRVGSLQELVQKIRADVDATLNSLEHVAARCDRELHLG